MKNDQREAEEVTMKVYLHKISLEKNVFSLRGFPLRRAGSAITRRMEIRLRWFNLRYHAVRSRWNFCCCDGRERLEAHDGCSGNNDIFKTSRNPDYHSEGLTLPNTTLWRPAQNSAQAVPKTTPARYSVSMMHPPMPMMIIRALTCLTGPFRLVN